jgi:hypothetical protein
MISAIPVFIGYDRGIEVHGSLPNVVPPRLTVLKAEFQAYGLVFVMQFHKIGDLCKVDRTITENFSNYEQTGWLDLVV